MKSLVSISEEQKDFSGRSVYKIKALNVISEDSIKQMLIDMFKTDKISVMCNFFQTTKYVIWEVCIISGDEEEDEDELESPEDFFEVYK
jgi:hypothetical protein